MKTRKRKLPSTPEEAPPVVPELPAEILVDILVRVPVKHLLRCRSVCKAWRSMVSDPSFVRAQLRRSVSMWEQDPSVIITPITRLIPRDDRRRPTPVRFSSHFRFYEWHQQSARVAQDQVARFMHSVDFGKKTTMIKDSVVHFAHCDGLVLVPTDTKLYLFNPATRDSIILPNSERNDRRYPISACNCVGLGLDPRTGKYKVVQAFYRSQSGHAMGMEVFTVNDDNGGTGGGGAWRKTAYKPPRYPLARLQVGKTVKGFIFWVIDGDRHYEPAPFGLLRLSLASEEFHVTMLPDAVRECDPLYTVEALLHGGHGHDGGGQQQLCLMSDHAGDGSAATIWTMSIDDDGGEGQWEPRFSVPMPYYVHPMAFVAGGSRMLLWSEHKCRLCSYDLATSELTTLCLMDRMKYQGRRERIWGKKLWNTVVVPYTESLVRVTAAHQPSHAMTVTDGDLTNSMQHNSTNKHILRTMLARWKKEG